MWKVLSNLGGNHTLFFFYFTNFQHIISLDEGIFVSVAIMYSLSSNKKK